MSIKRGEVVQGQRLTTWPVLAFILVLCAMANVVNCDNDEILFTPQVLSENFEETYSTTENSDEGFEIQELSGSETSFHSPGYPNDYSNNLHYQFVFKETKVVEITFQDFDLEKSEDCYADKLIINHKPYCGNDLAYQTIAHKYPFSMTLITDSENTAKGFNATYKYLSDNYREETCDALTNQQNGIIAAHHNMHGSDRRCYYRFDGLPGYGSIKIHFTVFNISNSNFELTERFNIEYHYILRYSGSSLQDKTVSYKLPLKMEISSYRNSDYNLRLTYTYIRRCEINPSSNYSGIIHSPAYPKNYSNDYSCFSDFPKYPHYNNIEINFKNFSLEKSKGCKYDKLIMNNGMPYCGSDLEDQIVVRRLPFNISVVTNNKVTSSGFYATYKYQRYDTRETETCESPTNKPQGSVIIKTLNPHHRTCVYKFSRTDSYDRIEIHFNAFKYDQDYGESLFIQAANYYHRFTYQQLFHKSVVLYLPLEIKISEYEYSANHDDFIMNYRYIVDCNKNAEPTSGNISSIGFPLNYINYASCEYRFARYNNFCGLNIVFTDFSIENSPGCHNDKLTIDSLDYCGTDLLNKSIAILLPTSLHLSSNDEITGKGFRATYNYLSNCDQVYEYSLKVKDTVITSPGFPKLYPDNLWSVHTLTLDRQSYRQGFSKIEIMFRMFDMESSKDCANDGFIIGKDKYCGNQLQHRKVTYDLPVTLKFYSNGNGRYKGFLATYTYVTDKDEDNVIEVAMDDLKGRFDSSEYRSYFQSPMTYRYSFDRRDGFCSVKLSFKDFHLSKYSNCKNEYVRVLNHTYCGEDLLNKDVIVRNFPFSVIYVVNNQVMGRFMAEYDYITDCEEKTFGIISSPEYPLYRPALNVTHRFNEVSSYCGVQLKFLDFALQYSSKCSKDSLSLNGSPFCGNDLQNKTVVYDLPTKLTFVSDQHVNGRGFLVQYKYLKNCSQICNKDYYNAKGYITPTLLTDGDGQGGDIYCSFVIHKQDNARCVKLSFPILNICGSNGYLKIDGKEYCGSHDQVITSFDKNDMAVISWKSDGKNNLDGAFTMIYTQEHDELHCIQRCEQTLDPNWRTDGVIQTPYYPRANLQCSYKFTKDDRYCAVELNFKSFNLRHSLRCHSERLEIDHISYCSQQLLNTKVTKFVPLTLTFVSDTQRNETNFIADYRYLTDCTQACKKDLRTKYGYITPQKRLLRNNYKLNCTYRIHRMAGAKCLAINMLQLDLCRHQQYVLIDQNRYCQTVNNKPIKVISSFAENESIKEVKFINNENNGTAGNFIIRYEQVTSGDICRLGNKCGPAFTKKEGFLSQPDDVTMSLGSNSCVFYILPYKSSTNVTVSVLWSIPENSSLTVLQGIMPENNNALGFGENTVKFPKDEAKVKPVIIHYHSEERKDVQEFKVYVNQVSTSTLILPYEETLD